MGYWRRCPNCHKLYQGDKCPECRKKFGLRNTKKRYAEDEGRRLYGTYGWRRFRDSIRLHFMDYDIWLMGAGIVRRCDKVVIHHIVERDRDPDRIFDPDNVITVSPESHAEIHAWYKVARKAALDRIAEGVARFNKTIGDG